MTKGVLILNKKNIRSLEELRDNFNFEDLLYYFKNKMLHNWLYARGYFNILQQLDNIQTTNESRIDSELTRIFKNEINIDEHEAQRAADILIVPDTLDKYEKSCCYTNKIILNNFIQNYHDGYKKLSKFIFENRPRDINETKAAIKEIGNSYLELFILDHKAFFDTCLGLSTQTIFVMLMNNNMRMYFLPTPEEEAEPWRLSPEKRKMYEAIKGLIRNHNDMLNLLGDNLWICQRNTNNQWEQIVDQGQKCMIIKMEEGAYVRGVKSNKEYKFNHTKDKFIILDGIEYRSDSQYQLLYMLV